MISVVVNGAPYISEAHASAVRARHLSTIANLTDALEEIHAEVGLADSIGLAAAVQRLERIREVAAAALAGEWPS